MNRSLPISEMYGFGASMATSPVNRTSSTNTSALRWSNPVVSKNVSRTVICVTLSGTFSTNGFPYGARDSS